MISLLKSNNTTNQISTPSTNLNDYTSRIFSFLLNKNKYYTFLSVSITTATIYDVGNGGISNDPPCSSHTVVNDPSRNVGTSGIGGACDNGPLFNTSIGGRWIRFLGTGGTMIPSTSPGRQHCSAYLAGWANVTLPSTNGTVANGTGCFETIIAICGFQIDIEIVNCNTFYVYFLPPLSFCNARYCTI
jgi:hypothetical protein